MGLKNIPSRGERVRVREEDVNDALRMRVFKHFIQTASVLSILISFIVVLFPCFIII